MEKIHHARIAKGKVDIWSINGNICVGTDILKEYTKIAGGNIKRALQLYNGSANDKTYKYSNKVLEKMHSFMIASR
jgi:soluble lytic murein transglycosylase-like protein